MYQHKGFALLSELSVCLAIVAICVSIAAPSLSLLVKKTTASSDLNGLSHDLNFARMNAVSKRQYTIVCPSADQRHCTNDWALTHMIFEDINNNEQRDSEEPLLYLHEGFDKSRQLIWRSFGSKPFIRFDYRGTTQFQSGRLYWCDRNKKIKQQLIVYRTGRIRKAYGNFIKDSCG